MLTSVHSFFRASVAFITLSVLLSFTTQSHAQRITSDNLVEFILESPGSQGTRDLPGGLRYGKAVAVDGNHAVIASNEFVYFLYYDGNEWGVSSRTDAYNTAASVAIDDGLVVIGYPDENNPLISGSIEIFRLQHDPDGAPEWIIEQRLTSFSGNFGYNVATQGGRIAVSNTTVITSDRRFGSVQLLERENGTWVIKETITAPAEDLREMGSGIAFNERGNQLAIIAKDADSQRAEHPIFLYRQAEDGGWEFDRSIQYGLSGVATVGYETRVSIAFLSDLIAVGTPIANNGAGEVQLFTPKDGVWNRTTVRGAFEGNNFGQSFGTDLSLIDGLLAVSAPTYYFANIGDSQGSIFLFREVQSGWEQFLRIDNPVTEFQIERGFANDITLDASGKLLTSQPNFRNQEGGSVGEAYMYFVLPVTPVDLAASDGGNRTSSIDIRWQREIGRDGFRVYERGVDQAIEIIESSSATNYTVSNLANGEIREYGVSSFKVINGISFESPIQWDIGYTQPDGRLGGTILSQSGAEMPDALVRAESDNPVQGAHFDGSGFISIPHRSTLVLPDSFTIEATIRADGEVSQRHTIYSTQAAADDGGFTLEAGRGSGGSGRLALSSNGNWIIQSVDEVILPDTYHHVAYVREGDTHILYVDGDTVAVETYTEAFMNSSANKHLGAGPGLINGFTGEIAEVRLWNDVRSPGEINKFKTLFLGGNEEDLQAYWRLNGEWEGSAIDWAGSGAHGQMINTTYKLSEAQRTWGSYTNDEGAFRISNIRYSPNGTDFVLTPSFGLNEYNPASRTRRLENGQSSVVSINFTDITTFSISGRVTFDGTPCFAPNVDIELNGVVSGTTDEQGYFNIAVLQNGENVIRPVFGEHPFEPAERVLNVITDINNADFQNLQRRTISGQVAGGDRRLPIGLGNITATGANNCSVWEETTDAAGNYTLDLPALPELVLEARVPTNNDITFQAREINLSDTSSTQDFIYRTEPIISLNGLPAPTSCDVRVLEQLENYFVEIEAYEIYGEDTSPVENGRILINNGIADSPNVDTLQIDNGIAIYQFNAGAPNIVAGGERPYQKLLSMEVQTGDQEVDSQYAFNRVFDEWAIVEGSRPREQTFTTVSPEIPFFILRDPPGDQSYSFLSEEQSVCRTMSLSRLSGNGSSVWGKVKVGTKFEAGLGVSVETEIWGEVGGNKTISATQISQDEVETCLTSTGRFTTADSDQFIGEDGDLYVGAAMNILYAITDVLSYNVAACRVDLSKDIIFGNEGFATNYIYTESHIRDVVIPDLDRIRSIPGISADSVAFLTDQIDVWQQTLDMNQDIKNDLVFAEPLDNYTISGGPGREYAETSTLSSSRSIEFSMNIDDEVTTELGAEVGGSGISGGNTIRIQTTMGESETVQRTQSNTVGFFLGDNDSGDSFTVNVKEDPVFGTFVFELVAGTSSCPWEPGTLPRDGTQLTVDSPTQVDVPEDQPAVFRLTLGNVGQNEEAREYRLNAIPGSNPDGAVILINGIPISDLEPYTIPAGSSIDQTLTVARGPSAFDYENLELIMRSTCDAAIADTVALTVRYQSSCSPMVLDFPEDNWIVNANSGDKLDIAVSGYNRDAFNNILLQYSPIGQNNWSTSRLISSADMPNNRANLEWDVSNMVDGEYEFRVAVQCDAGVTYTSRVSGSIRRSGLLVEGIPSPSDEILNTGDVINVTFNRNIEPSSVLAENLRLVDLTTGEKIAFSHVVSDRGVTLTPEGDPGDLQNRLLQASVTGVVDLSGNPQVQAATWKFRVRQNPIVWNRAVIQQNILLGDGGETTLTAELTNQAAVEEAFTITKTPDWLDTVTPSGTLQPGESQLIAFRPDPLLGAGLYRDTVVTQTSLGNENLIIEYGIQCEPPAWELNAASFSNSMNLVANFYIENVPFSKENDVIAAFVGDELRGVTRVVPSIPSDPSMRGYLYTGFLTIHSNQTSGEEVRFRIWDAAACQVMDIVNTLEFQSDAVVGSADAPEQFTVTGAVLQSIPMEPGNNWISLGVEATNMSVNNALSRVRARDGDVIISQSGFNQYVLGAGWVGQIDSLNPGIMYKMILANASSLDLIGEPVNGEDRPIAVTEGWNWIGYLPDQPLPVSDALASLSPAGGDIIRSQTAFSQYSSNSGMWEGNLSALRPGTGYKLRRNERGTLIYPGAMDQNSIEMQRISTAEEPGWEVNAADFEQVMAVTGRLTLGGEVITGDAPWLSAWIDGEIRGIAQAVNVLDQWLYFMNVYGELNDEESMIEFRAWHPEMGLYENLSGSVSFTAEGVMGSPREPMEFFGEFVTSVEGTADGLPIAFELNQNYPNPFNPTTQIVFALPEASDVRLEVFNVIGQRVAVLVNEQRVAGYHHVRFDGSSLASGVYFYRIQAGSFVKTQKMMLLK